MNILLQLKTRLRAALETLTDEVDELVEMLRPTQDPKFGDYQANCAMPLGKQLGKPPREIAEQIAAALDVADLCQAPEIAGPGFINLRLNDEWLVEQLDKALHDERLNVAPAAEPRKYVIDYSSPNVAKAMHVGHIRSTVIGDALCRMLRFLGHQVTSDNHLGDWGTQFGMIIYGYKHFVDQTAYQAQPVVELGRLYKLVNQLAEYHAAKKELPASKNRVAEIEDLVAEQESAPSTGDKSKDKAARKRLGKLRGQLSEAGEKLGGVESKISRVENNPQLAALAAQHSDIGNSVLEETARLHADDAENRRLWEEFLPHCRQDIQRIYDRLGIHFDCELGESFYHERLAPVVADLQKRGLATESDGAICIFLDDYETPMIVQKKDGAFLYATTDLATIQYRLETWSPDAILYVVDHRQGEHFGKLFAVAEKWGHENVELRHVSFGTVLGEDKKPIKTRTGDNVNLETLLDEAVAKSLQVVSENDDAKPGGRELSDDERIQVAGVVGHGAVKYADLSHNRTSDYVFSLDKMTSLQGNTGAYMQYSYARTQSILRKSGADVAALLAAGGRISLEHAAERSLTLQLLRFHEALDDSLVDYLPNQLTAYLFELAKSFSTFYEQCPVLKTESEALRNSRLLLCDLTGRTIKQGLALLGIDVVEKM